MKNEKWAVGFFPSLIATVIARGKTGCLENSLHCTTIRADLRLHLIPSPAYNEQIRLIIGRIVA